MLSVILFSLMVWWILWAYTKIQSANLKMANTQEAIQVAEDFLERINDTSLEYLVDTGEYNDIDQVNPGWYRKIFKSNTLYLKNNSWDQIKFYRECTASWYCTIKMNDIDLINNDKVTVNNLEFELYPDQQYVNINITTKNLQWETLYKSWITLSTTVRYKTYYIYDWELTPETMCEDVCSISDLSDTWTAESIKDVYINLMKFGSNNTMSSCTIWKWAWLEDNFWTNLWIAWHLIEVPEDRIFNIAKACDNHETPRCWTHCDPNTPGKNPFNCWYIRNEVKKWRLWQWWFTWTTCSWYDSYIRENACTDMCISSIFSCIENDDSLIKRTGIYIDTWEFKSFYLQNPQPHDVDDNQSYINGTWSWQNWWQCTNWTIKKDTNYDFSSWWEALRTAIFGSNKKNYAYCSDEQGKLFCNGTYYWSGKNSGLPRLSLEEYSDDCIKRTWKTWANSSTKSGKRIIYTPEPSNISWINCICQVAYTYNLNAWWVIEDGGYWWMQAIVTDKNFTFEQNTTELDFIPKEKKLNYVDTFQWNTQWMDLTGIKEWLWIWNLFNNEYCDFYDNWVCKSNVSYTHTYMTNKYDEGLWWLGAHYEIVTTNKTTTHILANSGWFFSLDEENIPYNRLACVNREEYNTCITSWCCPPPWEFKHIYTKSHNITDDNAKEYWCKNIKNWYWKNNKCCKRNTNSCTTSASYTPVPTSSTDLNKYKSWYCVINRWWKRDSGTNICLQTWSLEYLCIKWVWACPDNNVEWETKTIEWSTVKYCKYSEYDYCIAWRDKNIYKDYSYLCWFSVTEQTNSILNIIHSINNTSQTTVNRKESWWRRIFW